MRRHASPLSVLFFCAALIMAACGVFLLFYTHDASAGHLRISVQDAYTAMPLAGAYVLLPESGIGGLTDAKGVIDLYNIPIRPDRALDKLLPQGFGSTTVLCYAKGYRAYALFHVQVYPGRIRTPTLFLFPGNAQDGAVTMIESPPDGWAEKLLAKYAPDASVYSERIQE